ncbi:MAG: hypothetical protein K9K21_01745 [Desulfotignum sp.]|nr:hypothetical protein [Desulfotignum sp.]MCF8112555.1 hypothetical protein [Desulfotignum sp.]
MINRSTVGVLGLKPVTRNMCYDFYMKINSEFDTPDAIKESISWWQDNKDKLNELWWVLNYYSESLDPERELRAHVEHHLDALALEKTAALETLPGQETTQALEQA